MHILRSLVLCVCAIHYWATVGAALQKGITQIDADRRAYLQLEATLWQHIAAADTPAGRLVEVFAQHRNFTEQRLGRELLGVGVGDEFIVLNGLYEWKLIEQDMRSLHNLFDVYRMTLEQYRNVRDDFDELALNDLAETVLHDDGGPFKVAATLEQIENVMVRQNLYYKAKLVGIC